MELSLLPTPMPVNPNNVDSRLSQALSASARMPALLDALILAHFEFEGWPTTGLQPGPSMKATYAPAAGLAVRYASEPCRRVAENCARDLALARFGDVAEACNMLSAAERTADEDHVIADFARDIIATYLSHLTSGLRSQVEWQQFQKDEAEL